MENDGSRWPAFAIWPALLLLALGTAVDAAPQGGIDSAVGRRARSLLEQLDADPAADADAIAGELIDFGPTLLPTLKAMEGAMNTPAQIEVMAAVRHRQEDPGLSAWLTRLASSAESEESRSAAYAALEVCGNRECLEPLLSSLAGNPPTLKRQADRALTAVLRRSDDDAGYALVERSLPGLTDEDRARVAACVARADSPRGLELLLRLVGRYPGIHLSILSGLAGMKSRPADGSLAHCIRPLLSSDESNLRREAVSALGNLHDGESVEEILSLLGGEQAGVAGNAHWALKKLSGLNLPRDPIRWKMWLTAERSWWEEEGRLLLTALEEGDPEHLLRALHQASLHPLYRAEFTPLLEEYAEATDADLQAAARLALARLDPGPGRAPAVGGGGTMVSLRPIPAGEAPLVQATGGKDRKESPPAEDSTLLFLLLGLPVCLSLLMKVGGLPPVALVRSWFKRGARRPGPMTVKLSRRAEGKK